MSLTFFLTASIFLCYSTCFCLAGCRRACTQVCAWHRWVCREHGRPEREDYGEHGCLKLVKGRMGRKQAVWRAESRLAIFFARLAVVPKTTRTRCTDLPEPCMMLEAGQRPDGG